MKPLPSCLPCVLHQALQVARQVSEDEWSQRKVLNEVLRVLPEAEWHQSSPAEILGDAIETARKTLKVRQPFEERCEEVQKTFLAMAEEFKERLEQAEDPLALSIVAAGAANLVDELVFDRFARRDPKQIFEEALEAGFEAGGTEALTKAIDGASAVLYFLDNSGEVFFDALLIEQLQAKGKTVRVVVRGGGLLHDATIDHAREALGIPAPQVPTESEEGEAQPAVGGEEPPDEAAEEPPAEASTASDGGLQLIDLGHGDLAMRAISRNSELGEALAASDLVIAKGSSYYQTLIAKETEVFHLLRAKCHPVATSLGVQPGALVLLHIPAQDDS